MNISLNWLKDYLDLPENEKDVSERLTMLGFEVDEVLQIGSSLEGIDIGEVLSVEPHPNADKLRVCQVRFGEGEPFQIVCGAPNVAPGQFVPVAKVGTTLTVRSKKEEGEMEVIVLKQVKLRGEESNGMICSEAELGLSEEHDGIMVLEEGAISGTPFSDYLKERKVESHDIVFDIALTPNRPDGTYHLGVARDLAAQFDRKLEYPEEYSRSAALEDNSDLEINIEDADGCHRYVGIVIEGVQISESPAWLKSRLSAIGLRPINNIVDITNFVMYECGQPLHAFDLSRVTESKIIIRSSLPDEKFTTLDDKERELPANTLMICDASGSVAIAGIMGGQNSEVDDRTKDILLEAAYFDPSRIRKAAKLLNMQTDASYRFERGVDPESTLKAATRAAKLIVDLAGGKISGGKDAKARSFERSHIELRPSRVAKLLGFEIERSRIVNILNSIEIKSNQVSPDCVSCEVPGFRPDIEREIDLIEEVVRLYGYDNVELPSLVTIPAVLPKSSKSETARIEVLGYLSGKGYRETYTNSLIPVERGLLFASEDELVQTVNPISRENASLRPSMLAGILPVVAYNKNRGHKSIQFAEFGYVFSKTDPGNKSNLVPGYLQREILCLVQSGISSRKGWNQEERGGDLFDIKQVVEDLLDFLGLAAVEIGKKSVHGENGMLNIVVHAQKKRIGKIGILGRKIGQSFDLDDQVYFAELDWSIIGQLLNRKGRRFYQEIQRFPSTSRDLALIVDQSVRAGDMISSIRQASSSILSEIDIFDIYSGDKLGGSGKSIAFSLTFSTDRTLQDKEIDKQIDRILGRLQKDFGAELRS